jgi:hypothetical protein
MHRQIPKRCIRCVRREDSEDEAYSEARAARERERRAAKKTLENHPEERIERCGITVPGWGFAPFLLGTFGRWNQNGHEHLSRPPSLVEWAADDADA